MKRLALLWIISTICALAPPARATQRLLIERVEPDYAMERLFIYGRHLGRRPSVRLDDLELEVLFALPTRIEARLPGILTMPPGTYRLVVERPGKPWGRSLRIDFMDVTLGIAGPKGDPGPPGPPGTTGANGSDGADGAPGVSCWDTNHNFACDLSSEDIDADGSCTALDCSASAIGISADDIAELLDRLHSVERQLPFWAVSFGGEDEDIAQSVAVDPNGDVIVAGHFSGTVDFGGGQLASNGNRDIFVAKYSGANGSHLWSRAFGGAGFDSAHSLAVDDDGNPIVTGRFAEEANFGGGGLQGQGNGDIFVTKLDQDGSHLWSHAFGGTGVDFGSSVAVGANGNVVVTGAFAESVAFGPDNQVSAGSSDIFAVELDADGTQLWSRRFGGVAADRAARPASIPTETSRLPVFTRMRFNWVRSRTRVKGVPTSSCFL